MDEIPLEAAPEDVIDQRTDVVPEDQPGPGSAPVESELPWDANPADVADQRAEVLLDDDWQ